MPKFNTKLRESRAVSVIIPTYNRENVLLNTIDSLLSLQLAPAEILIIDQTKKHHSLTEQKLALFERENKIRWICLPYPSIPHAMNTGLQLARHLIVLFLDDDIIPSKNLIGAHLRVHLDEKQNIVAGQVLQPGEKLLLDNFKTPFHFSSNRRQFVTEVIGCNFSVKREWAVALGGFDENFVKVAYRFEAEFCDRAMAAGEKIIFEPAASIRHLKTDAGGTRTYGKHLTTLSPGHSVGAYYYLLRSECKHHRIWKIIFHPLYAIKSRFHLKHPWWIPITMIAELRGFLLALFLKANGPKYIAPLKGKEKGNA